VPDYLSLVFDMLGPGGHRYADPAAWVELEAELGIALPDDYKAIVDAYAPIKINGHLYLSHPATERWNLGESIRSTAEAWSAIDWDDFDPDEDPRVVLGLPELEFGTKEGLLPIASTDRGDTVFLAPLPDSQERRLCIADGDGGWYEYRIGFAEWLYRFLVGEDMAGPNSSAFYPGPVVLEPLPMSQGDRPAAFHGPDRGM